MSHRETVKRSSRLAGVDGVRALAALSVLAYHVWLYSFLGNAVATSEGGVPLGPATKVFDMLRSGLTLFFVLSGFLLFRPYAAAIIRGSRFPSTRAYLRNRSLRILPAYWAILLAVGVLFQHGLLTSPSKLLTNAAFVRTYVPSFERWDGTALAYDGLGIGPAWTLMVEVVFYLALPILGLLAARATIRSGLRSEVAVWIPVAPLVLVGVFGQAVVGVFEVGRPFQESFLPWAGFFAPGMALAVLYVLREDGRLRLPSWWRVGAVAGGGLVAALALKLYYAGTMSYPEAQWVIAVAFALLLAVVVFAGEGSRVVTVLEWRPLVAIGLASYSVYLWHDPIVNGFRDQGWTFSGRGGFVVNLVLIGAVTLAASALTYRLVERPALALKRPVVAGRTPQLNPAPHRALLNRVGEGLSRFRSTRLPAPEWLREPDVRLRRRRVAVRRRIEALVGRLEPSLGSLVTVSGGERLTVQADPDGFDRVVSAVLENALEYGKSPVHIEMSRGDGSLRLSIDDEGRGVDSAFVPHLFEPYSRSEPSRHTRTGSGLGLAVADLYARAMGGEVDYEPRSPGARFVIQLPLARDLPHALRRRSTRKPSRLSVGSFPSKRSLLRLRAAGGGWTSPDLPPLLDTRSI